MWSSWSFSLVSRFELAPGFVLRAAPPPVLLDTGSSAGSRGRRGKGPKADLQHKGVTQHGRGSAGGVTVGRDVVGRQHEAVIDIAGAHDVLVDLVGLEVPSGGSRHHPDRRPLDRAAAQKSFAAGQVSQVRLWGIIAVHQADRPAVEVRTAFRLETLHAKRRLIEP